MDRLTALALATMILVAIPGPNVALIVGRSLQRGARAGIATTFGTTVGVAIQLLLVIAGIAVLVDVAAAALGVLRWLGVFYLLILAFRYWRQPESDPALPEGRPADREEFGRGALLALANPKTLVFNAAFLPQFVDPSEALLPQLVLLSAVYLGVLFAGDCLWAMLANSARKWFGRYSRFQNRLSAMFLAAAGIALAYSRRAG